MSVPPIGATNCWDCTPLVAMLQPQSAQGTGVLSLLNNSRAGAARNEDRWLPDTRSNLFGQLLTISLALYDQGFEKEEKILSPAYNRIYLQHPNDRLQALADEISSRYYSNDDKATATIQWVLKNFPYEEDLSNYGHEELWAPPTFALRKGSGDCEDGAFIVHSLLLHSGISRERIRTYGGLVRAGEGAATGGHAWTAYRRESDNQWVILDTSYYPTFEHVVDRPMMKDASLYVDNFFYFDAIYWVNLEDVDRIHDPGAVYSYTLNSVVRNTAYETTGFLLDALA